MIDYCPNDCGICRKANEVCYYSDDNKSYVCQVCKKNKSPHDVYEYKGFESCPDCFDELQKRVDEKIKDANEQVKASTYSQRAGEFINNSKKYDIHNVASDGLPIIKVKSPAICEDIRDGKL